MVPPVPVKVRFCAVSIYWKSSETKGSIVVDGQEITDKKADINKLRQHIGMVFQHFNLFPHLTVEK